MTKERIRCALSLLLVMAVLTVTGTVYAQDTPAQVRLPFKAERPRLVFSKAQIPVIKARCEGPYRDDYQKMVAWANEQAKYVLSGAFAAAWKETMEKKARSWVKMRAIRNLYAPRFQTFGLLWHLTGDKRYAEAGRRVLASMFLLLKDPGAVQIRIDRELTLDCAAGYDLFYDALTAEECKTWGDKLFWMLRQKRRVMHMRSYHGFGAPASVLVALYGTDVEPDEVNRRLAKAYDYATNFYLRGFGLISRNRGGWNEGTFCMCMSKAHQIPFWWRWQNATGEKFFETNPTFYGMGTWLVYHLMDLSRDKLSPYSVPTPSIHRLVELQQVDICSALADDGVGTWLTRRMGQDKAATPDLLWRKILLYPPGLKEVRPEELPETAVFEGWGWVSMRSGWDADAVFAHFSSGMKGQGEPAHLDNNQFIIYHKGLLAIDGTKPRATAKFPDTYCRMSLAHNTLTLYDPEEKIWGRSLYVYTQNRKRPFAVNDGGQTFRKDCYLDNIYNVRGPSKMVKQGDIVAYETSPLYDYVCGDATKSYSAHKMKHFTRQFVFCKPDVFVVFDRVVSTKKVYRKRWHLHFFEEPVVEGTLTHADYDDGRLWCETLLPKDATVKKVHGSQVEQADGTYLLPEVWKKRDSDSWRIDVGPPEARSDDLFLHVLQAVDAGEPRTFAAETLRGEGAVGARVKRGNRTVEVLFATAGNPAGRIRIVEEAKPLVDRDLPEKVVDSYAQWKDDPRFRMWMTDERFRYTIPKADRQQFAAK